MRFLKELNCFPKLGREGDIKLSVTDIEELEEPDRLFQPHLLISQGRSRDPEKFEEML